jgi:uncharacterized protein
MQIIDFTPVPALIGGALIGLSASLMLALHGRVAGISGILFGMMSHNRKEVLWRSIFVIGLLLGSFLGFETELSPTKLNLFNAPVLYIIGGFLVGFGATLGSGCTSGHGVCGLSRLSRRSIIATMIFMMTGMLTVFIQRHVLV